MGHVRVGRLPKRRGWEEVLSALSTNEQSEGTLVAATARAAKIVLSDARHQGGLVSALFTFLELASASRVERIADYVRQRGAIVPEAPTGLALIRAISDLLQREIRRKGAQTLFDQIAVETFNAVFLRAVQEESRTLFGCTANTVRDALRKLSTKTRIASLGRQFFSEYTYRALRMALERELGRTVGGNGRFTTSAEVAEFDERLKAYCWDISKIVEEFSGGWYSKVVWQQRLTLDEVRGFTSYAIEKLLSELSRSRRTYEGR
jgi:hypothetical protein